MPDSPVSVPTKSAPTKNQRLLEWVTRIAERTQPAAIEWCDGSQDEYDHMFEIMLSTGTAERLNDATRPNSYLVLSDPADVARVEDRTFICCEKAEDAVRQCVEILLQR